LLDWAALDTQGSFSWADTTEEACSTAAAITEANETELSPVIQFSDLAYAAAASLTDIALAGSAMPEEHFRRSRILF
jgi:hypothetical protein